MNCVVHRTRFNKIYRIVDQYPPIYWWVSLFSFFSFRFYFAWCVVSCRCVFLPNSQQLQMPSQSYLPALRHHRNYIGNYLFEIEWISKQQQHFQSNRISCCRQNGTPTKIRSSQATAAVAALSVSIHTHLISFVRVTSQFPKAKPNSNVTAYSKYRNTQRRKELPTNVRTKERKTETDIEKATTVDRQNEEAIP